MKQASEIPCEKMCSVLGYVLANLLLVHLSKDNTDSSGFALLPSTSGSSRLELLGRDSYRISYDVEVQSLHLGTLSRFHPSFIHKTLAETTQNSLAPRSVTSGNRASRHAKGSRVWEVASSLRIFDEIRLWGLMEKDKRKSFSTK